MVWDVTDDGGWAARMSAKAKAREGTAATEEGRTVTDPMYPKPGEQPNLAQWLWQQGAHVGYWLPGVVWSVLEYEQKLDAAEGCGHSSNQIMAGECPERNPGDMPALQWLAAPISDRPGFREEWEAPPLMA